MAVKKGGCPLSAGLREGHAPRLHAFRQRPATWEGRMPARRKTHCRGGFHIRPETLRRRRGCGTMRASSPTGVCHRTGFAVSRLAADLAVVRRGGIYPSRGRLRRRGVRRDEGIPPYGHFIGSAYTGKAACFRRGICGRGMPLPYTPSGNDRPHGKAGCPPGGKPIVGADSISARFAAPRGCPGRCKHRPLQGVVITRRLWFPGWPRTCRGS